MRVLHFKYLFLALMLAPVFSLNASDVIVSKSGDIKTIREAIEISEEGGSILIREGIYQEGALIIDKSVFIRGEGNVVLDGQGEFQILTVKAANVRIQGLTFRNVGTSFVEDRAALKIEEGHNCVVEANNFENTFFAIYLAKVDGCRIRSNTIIGSGETQTKSANGIHLWYSKNVEIKDNLVRGHRDGIYMEFVEDSRVEGNISEGNKRYGLHFMFSDRCIYQDNILRKNSAGVAVMYTEGVEMLGNRFEDNWGAASFGLLLKDIRDSKIIGNTFLRNTIGIFTEGSNRMEVRDNDFIGNGWAVKIMANATNNRFSDNNFQENSFDVATNSRHSNSVFEGNYWDNYKGYDLDKDGIGDVAFRPVRLFTLLVEKNEPSILLMRSLFVSMLDMAERALPVLTPEAFIDAKPKMRPRQ